MGLIPAHAGKTISMPVTGDRLRAHPRSRGENKTPLKNQHTEQGSSPLTRGKLLVAREGQGGEGLIPAHAGKTILLT